MAFDSSNYFLKKTLGQDFLESLEKFELWKPGTKSVVDPEEIKTALKIVPRTIMSLLIRELVPMAIGENKDITLPVSPEAILHVTKHERDVLSGEITQENKRVTEFKFRSIPGVGLVIMSAFELYDVDQLTKPASESPEIQDVGRQIQAKIDERLALHDLVNKVVDKKIAEKDAIQQLILAKLTQELEEKKEQKKKIADLAQVAKDSAPMEEEYFRGMANGIEVINATVNDHEPDFVGPKKGSPLKDFLEARKKKKSPEHIFQLTKGEIVNCPDCGKDLFDGNVFSGCVCLGDDRDKKVYIKKSEDGFKIRFGKSWDPENIELLLEVLRRKRG